MTRTFGERLLDRASPVFGREEQLEVLERAFEDASDDNKPKEKVLLYGQSGLSKVQLVEIALGVNTQNSGHRRVSSDNPSRNNFSAHSNDGDKTTNMDATRGNIGSCAKTTYLYRRKRPLPGPCWYAFGKFTRNVEGKPFSELSRSIADLVTSQLLPESQRSSDVTASTSISGDSTSSIPTLHIPILAPCNGIKRYLRDHLSVNDESILIKFCPEIDHLHLYSAAERAIDQTKRAGLVVKNSAISVTNLLGKGLGEITRTYRPNTAIRLPSSIRNLTDASAEETGSTSAICSNGLERLSHVVGLFFRALSEIRTVVWVLDDLQYATKDGMSSLSFIESILDNSVLNRFLFCGIIRDDDETEQERSVLSLWLDDIPLLVELHISHMKEDNVKAMLMDLLHLDTAAIQDLATLIYHRTHGNDFFVFEMINYLQEEGVMYFSTHTYKWAFDIDEVKRKTMLSQNVLSFVVQRLLRLPLPVQRCLQFASFLGYRFDEDVLARVVRANFVRSCRQMQENKDIDTHDLLGVAVDEGFIELLTYPSVIRYKFVHLEIQTACENLFPDDDEMESQKLHWNIGAALWRGWRNLESYESIENRILFPCVKELNAGRNAYKPRKQTLEQLVRLNHEAAKRSYDLHAYFPAATWLETALSYMYLSAWDENYSLSLELYTFLAKMYLASGQLHRIPKAVRIVGEHAKSFQDRLQVDMVELFRCEMEGDIVNHIQKSISLLNCLGVSLSGDYFWYQAERKKKRIKMSLEALTDEEILAKTETLKSDDKTIQLIEQGLIHSLIFSADTGIDLNERYPNLETVVACKIVEAFIQDQSGRDSRAICLSLAACLFGEADHDKKLLRRFMRWITSSRDLADLRFSIRLAELALKVPEAENDLQTIPLVGFVRHWRSPLPNCAEYMLRGYNMGMERGDLRVASRAAWGYVLMYLFAGLPLNFLAKDVENILAIMVDYSQKFEAMKIFPVFQLILNLNGQSSNVLDLTSGDAMDRAAATGWIPRNEALDAALLLYTHCQEFGLATSVLEKLESKPLGIVRFHAAWHIRVYHMALVSIHNARKSVLQRNQWKKKAEMYFGMVQTWVDECKAINMGHRLKLLQAEMLTLQRPYPPDEVLMAAYDEAVVRSARSGFLQDAGRAAAHGANAVRNKTGKQQYARRSQEFYTSWDAYGVIAHLRKKNRVHRESCDERVSRPSSSGNGVQGRQRFLDEDGILQAHRSITAAEDKVQKATK